MDPLGEGSEVPTPQPFPRHVASGEVIVLANTHLFFHPNARHIRLLQVMCFAQLVQELREKHRGS